MDLRTSIFVGSLTICLHLTLTAANFEVGCPDFCTCKDNHVSCTDFQSLDLTFLPPQADTLIMSGGELEELPPAFFARAHMLKEVQIVNVNIRVVRGGAFRGLSNLELLAFYQSSFDIVEPDGFSGVHHIEQFHISDCHFGRVGKHAFAEITNVEAWQIWSSYFASLSDEAFYGLKDIHTIQIYQNNITYIGLDIFAGSERLVYVNFYANYIQTLSEGSFTHGIKVTERFIVYANKFECSCDIAWTKDDETFLTFLSSNECTYSGGDEPSQSTFRLSDLRKSVLCPESTPSAVSTEPSTIAAIVHTVAPFVVEEMDSWPNTDTDVETSFDVVFSLHEGNVNKHNVTMLDKNTTSANNSSEMPIENQSNADSSYKTTSPSFASSHSSEAAFSVDSSVATNLDKTVENALVSSSVKHASTVSASSSFFTPDSADNTSTFVSLDTTETSRENSELPSLSQSSSEPTVNPFEEVSSSASSIKGKTLFSSSLSVSSSVPASSSSSPLSSTSFSSPTVPPAPIATSESLPFTDSYSDLDNMNVGSSAAPIPPSADMSSPSISSNNPTPFVNPSTSPQDLREQDSILSFSSSASSLSSSSLPLSSSPVDDNIANQEQSSMAVKSTPLSVDEQSTQHEVLLLHENQNQGSTSGSIVFKSSHDLLEIPPFDETPSSNTDTSDDMSSQTDSSELSPSPTTSSIPTSTLLSKIILAVASNTEKSSLDALLVSNFSLQGSSTSQPMPHTSLSISSSSNAEDSPQLKESQSSKNPTSSEKNTNIDETSKGTMDNDETSGSNMDRGEATPRQMPIVREELAPARLAPVIGEKQEQRQALQEATPDSTSSVEHEVTTQPSSSHVSHANCFLVVCLLSIRYFISSSFTG